ncbi:MAG: cytochrome p460 [Spirochaetae bacterium HGW-Spirochaetae-1]|jgi:hypothetical protein|nr:MAG: cytochrome p460 [Spirochaetae bacterium HGW-Spirochaetae-1]
MKRSLIIIVILGITAYLYSRGFDAGKLPDLKAPNGLELNRANGYDSWELVAAHMRVDRDEMHVIWGNDTAARSYKKAGTQKPFFENGSILVKLGYTLGQNPDFQSSIEPVQIMRIEYMIKDDKKFKKTGGWGYARFPYNQAGNTFSVYGADADFARECFNCHMRVKERDFVFTRHLSYLSGKAVDKVSLVVKEQK